VFVCLFVRNFDAKYLSDLEVRLGNLQESAYGASIGDVIDKVT